MKHIIGLTGQSGSGKSTIASIIKQHNIEILDCDEIAHKNMEPEGIAYNEIVEYFGKEILNSDNTINRKKLGNIVFNDKNKLNKLNEITHKHIYNYVKKAVSESKKTVIIDAPLLFEAGLDSMCESIWAAVCDESIRLERVMKRDNISAEAAKIRFKNQKSSEFFKKNADVIFDNSGDIKTIKERVIYEINKISD